MAEFQEINDKINALENEAVKIAGFRGVNTQGFYEYVNALDEILDKLLVFRISGQKNEQGQKRPKY